MRSIRKLFAGGVALIVGVAGGYIASKAWIESA